MTSERSSLTNRGGQATTRIRVFPDMRRGQISPDNFGYLLEVIGSSIYDGIWVGEASPIENIGGIRKAVIDHLRKLNASVIRWPGGCFASAYDWRDGVGPRADRPRRTSFWNDRLPASVPAGPQRYDPNQFGTDEFMELCRLTGGRPILSANTRSLDASIFERWLEYCNSPEGSTTLAEQRTAAGYPQPHGVRYWTIGNEAWGFDGAMTVDAYLDAYKRFTSMAPDYGVELAFIACGAAPGESLEWVRRLVQQIELTLTPVPLSAVSLHYYAGFPGNGFAPGDTLLKARASEGGFVLPNPVSDNATEWYGILASYGGIEDYIERHWDIVAGSGLKLAIDEWGAICRTGTELSPTNFWSRAVTLRDALGVALTLDIFNRHCDKILLGCFTGLINQEGGLFLAEGDQFVATAVYHIFAMYAAHQGGASIEASFDTPQISFVYDGHPCSLWGLNGSASIKGKTVTLTVVNPNLIEDRETIIDFNGADISATSAQILTHEDFNAQNSFDQPNKLQPATVTTEIIGGSSVRINFPAASVASLTIELV